MSRRQIMCAACLAALGLIAATAEARPVVYTLHTVVSGQLGALTFVEALTTIRFVSDTRHVNGARDPVTGHLIYTDHLGMARVSVTVSGTTTTAEMTPGEIYLRYDVDSGIVGFGSSILPTYPIALGCMDSADPAHYTEDCSQGDWGNSFAWNPGMAGWEYGAYHGTVSALADATANPPDAVDLSAATLALPQNLSQTTLLTGNLHACAGLYTLDYLGFMYSCDVSAPRGLATSLGPLYLQDNRSLDIATTQANQGTLRVEVR